MSTDSKYPGVVDTAMAPSKQEQGSPDDLTPLEKRHIIRRLDGRLVVTCGVMYCVSLIDRTNLSAAAIAGMLEELQLTGIRYSILVLIFFITYTLLQPPATAVLRWIGPRPYLASLCFAFGVVMLGHGFTYSWTAMIPLRLLLGVFEAGLFPGCVYLISTWYTRYELHRRYTVFFLIGCVATGFGGILGYGFMQLAGKGGYNGWRWIFIMEGIITTVIASIGYFTLVDFPDKSPAKSWSFLSQRECDWVIQRIAKDRDDAVVEPFNLGKWARNGLDPKVWGFALIYCLTTATSYAIVYFLPIILRGMGFSVAEAQLLTAPPFAAAGLVMLAFSWVGDRYKTKAPIILFNAVLTIVGLVIMGYASGGGPRYVGVFLTVCGSNTNVPTILTYQANNIRGQWKRAFCSASQVAAGGIGGIVGSLVFRTEDAPLYRPGVYAIIACNALVFIVVSIMTLYFRRCNRLANEGRMIIEGLEGFRYTI